MTLPDHGRQSLAHVALSGRWRTLVTPPLSGAANMALDEALLARARRTGEKALRIYTWAAPTLSLGRNQMARGRINREAARELGVELVRRPTGGRALLHHREVTYSVTAPLHRDDSVREWYQAISAVLLRALRSLGVDAEPAHVSTRTPLPRSASCFVRADEGEITHRGRKLVGSALLREDGALLQHGSILLDDDQPLLRSLLPADEEPPEPAGTLREALPEVPSVTSVANALIAALHDSGAAESSVLELEPSVAQAALEAEVRYSSEAWTFRS